MGPITLGVLAGQGAGARAELPAAGGGRRLRRHGVPSRRAGIRRADRRARAAGATPLTRAAAGARAQPAAGVQRHAARDPASSRWRAATIRPARSTSFFICTGPAPSLDGKYTVFAEWWTAWRSSRRSSGAGGRGDTEGSGDAGASPRGEEAVRRRNSWPSRTRRQACRQRRRPNARAAREGGGPAFPKNADRGRCEESSPPSKACTRRRPRRSSARPSRRSRRGADSPSRSPAATRPAPIVTRGSPSRASASAFRGTRSTCSGGTNERCRRTIRFELRARLAHAAVIRGDGASASPPDGRRARRSPTPRRTTTPRPSRGLLASADVRRPSTSFISALAPTPTRRRCSPTRQSCTSAIVVSSPPTAPATAIAASTFTFPLINAARAIHVLAGGEREAAAVRAIAHRSAESGPLSGPAHRTCPWHCDLVPRCRSRVGTGIRALAASGSPDEIHPPITQITQIPWTEASPSTPSESRCDERDHSQFTSHSRSHQACEWSDLVRRGAALVHERRRSKGWPAAENRTKLTRADLARCPVEKSA